MIEKIRLKIWDFLGLGDNPEKDSIFFKMFEAFDTISDWWAELDIGAEMLKSLKKLKDNFLTIFKAEPDPSGGGSITRDKTTHPGGKDDTYKPPMTPEQQRAYDASTNQGDTGIPEKPGFFGNLWKGFKSDLSSSFSSPKKPTSHKSIPDDGGTTDMGGVKWNQLHSSGRKGVEAALWNIYGKHGKKPTFVSGLRDENHPLYNPKSQHAHGKAFDLRSKDLGSAKPKIASDLRSFFKNIGWFFQDEVAGQMNTTGTRATADHFHVHKAAYGANLGITKPTLILAGESGPEHLRLQPMTSPYAQMDQMKNNSFISGGGGGAVTIINQGGTQSSNTTAVVVPTTSRPAPIETGLLK